MQNDTEITEAELEKYFVRDDKERALVDRLMALDGDGCARVAELMRLFTEAKPAMQRLVARMKANDGEAFALGRRFIAGSISADELLAAA